MKALALQGVKLISLRCAGFDRVDLKACAYHGIKVVRVPTYSPQSVAEHAVAHMFALNRWVRGARGAWCSTCMRCGPGWMGVCGGGGGGRTRA